MPNVSSDIITRAKCIKWWLSRGGRIWEGIKYNMTRFLLIVIFLKLDRRHFTRISVLNTIYLRDRGNFTRENFQNALLKNYVFVTYDKCVWDRRYSNDTAEILLLLPHHNVVYSTPFSFGKVGKIRSFINLKKLSFQENVQDSFWIAFRFVSSHHSPLNTRCFFAPTYSAIVFFLELCGFLFAIL